MAKLLAGAAGLIVLTLTAYGAEVGAAEPQAASAGRVVYETLCLACHGARGEGAPNWQQPNEQGDMPAPPHDRTGHAWKHADGMLYHVVRDGWRDPFNKSEHLTMPALGQVLSPTQIREVIDYLKTMWTPEQRRFQGEESRKHPYPPEARKSAAPTRTPIKPKIKE